MKHIDIPIFDLKRQNEKILNEIMSAVKSVVTSGKFILGDSVKTLEATITERIGGQATGVGSGTDALYLALRAIGLTDGDEVITTPFTFVAPIEMIMRCGATPVFADIDPQTFNIDPERIKEKITGKTKAILPVHLFGLSADMLKINEIAQENNLYVIEDVAQSLGAKIAGDYCGAIGDLGCFSFFPTKILSCFGDGGMVITKNSNFADRIRMLRVHGAKKKYFHEDIGINSRLDELQAAVILVKIKYLDEWIKNRREIAKMYKEELGKFPIQLPVEPEGYFHVYNLFTIRVKDRDKLARFLNESGIGTITYYPSPLHIQPICKDFNYKKGDFPEAERACEEVLSLPMFPELTLQEIESITASFSSYY